MHDNWIWHGMLETKIKSPLKQLDTRVDNCIIFHESRMIHGK
jgi:hypothetical protein